MRGVRVMFVVYLLVICLGLAYAILLGVLEH
jgi:hypothetical protein